MALPLLNHKNVVRYFGCWAERIDKKEDMIIEKRVKEIQRKLKQQQQRLTSKNKKNHHSKKNSPVKK